MFPVDGAERALLSGKAERIGLDGSSFHAKDAEGREVANERQPLPDHASFAEGAQWLRDHPDDLQRWLAGVTSVDGKDGVATVQASLKP